MKGFNTLQAIGKALMMPIAVLPVAALLLRLGQPDLLDQPFISAAGLAIFDNIGLLFAAGIAIGLARDHHGAAALAGVVCYLVSTHGAGELLVISPSLAPELSEDITAVVLASEKQKAISRLSVPIGILSGLIAGIMYNRYSRVALPEFLAFFGGRRFVPIVCGLIGIVLAMIFGYSYEALDRGMNALSRAVLDAGHWGLFLYGFFNRLLIVTGLHHILNNIAWFSVGEFQGKTGDLVRFFAGDPQAGAFMTGFYPVMMFGLPAACLAMYHSIPKGRRRLSAGLLASVAFTSLLTGVTEPVEFSFMFAAPALYLIHALLTGISMLIVDLLNIRLGFGFSAGLIDYVLNYPLATNPLLLLVVGGLYASLYYVLFRTVIVAFNLSTPGRISDEIPEREAPVSDPALAFVDALGGVDNICEIGACTTRLRVTVNSSDNVKESELMKLGARGVIRPSKTTVQVVLGPHAERVADDIRATLDREKTHLSLSRSLKVAPANETNLLTAKNIIAALGGNDNVRNIDRRGNRVRVRLADAKLVDFNALEQKGLRTSTTLPDNILHLLFDTQTSETIDVYAQTMTNEKFRGNSTNP